MTPNESALFTTYEVSVSAWIVPQQGLAKIIAARHGGRVYVGDDLYTYGATGLSSVGVSLSSAEPLLLYLTEVLPGAYEVTDWFVATGNKLTVSGVSGTSAELIVKLQQASQLCASGTVN